jgi:integrase
MASFETRGSSTRAVVRIPGGGKKTATFDTLKEARAWAALMERKVEVEGGASNGGTVEELFETYLDAVASKTDTGRWNKVRLMKWCKDLQLASLRVADVKTHEINQWIERQRTRPSERTGAALSGATINRELTLMSAAFTYAIESLHWITVNPCHGAARPEEGQPRDRPLLTADEIRALRIATGYDEHPELSTKTSRVGACFLLSLETGMRSGELLRLRPIDYRRAESYVQVTAAEKGGRKGSKSGRNVTTAARKVPLTARAKELLDQLLATMPADQTPDPESGFAKPPYIVGISDRQRDILWRKARDKAGVHDLHFHDTKHEAATRLSKHIDVLALSHAIGTKDLRLLRDTYYNNDASRTASLLPPQLSRELPQP